MSHMNDEKGLVVRTFGGLMMEYNGQTLNFIKNSSAKAIQLLTLLLLHGKEGVPKQELLFDLYSQEEGVNLNRNLNNLIYRLKKQLSASPLPDEEYILLENGVCRFQSSFSVTVDAAAFREKAGSMEEESLKSACEMYQAEFLPGFSAELWAIYEARELKKLYFEAVNKLGMIYREKNELNLEQALYTHASRLYPFDNWQLKEIDMLIVARRYEEASVVCQNTIRLYYDELGISPGVEYTERQRTLERLMQHPVNSFKDVKEVLAQKDGGGAYYCYYQSFLDSCQILSRIAERSGQSIFLLLCTLNENTRGGYFATETS